MKRWIALNKIEFLLTKRQLVYYLLSVGMPTAFYLFFSGMYQDTPGGPANFMRDYLISMTAFSMMSTAMFSFPAVLHTDKINNWQKTLRHTPVNMVEYYLSKITSMMVDYLVSILVVFSVGHFVRGVDMPLGSWVGAALLLIVGRYSFCSAWIDLDTLAVQSADVSRGQSSLSRLGCFRRTLDAHLFISRLDASNRKVPTNLSVDGVAQDLLKRVWHQFISHSLSTCFSTVLFGLTIYLQGHKENA